MKLWGRILWTLLSGSRGRRGAPQGWALNSWKPRSSVSGRLNATEVVNHWTQVFEQRGVPEARESSEYIVAHVLGAKTFQSLRPVLWTKPLTPKQLQYIQELCSHRLQRMPVQYILGEWDFQGLSLKMEPPVFIPRPETEELVEWVLEEVAQRPPAVGAQGGPLILEVGCGSGAIALSLLSQLPESQVIAVDKGEAAVRLTRKNAQRLQLQDRIRIVPLDITSEGCWTHLLPWGPIDLVVSNPPYVFHKDMEQLAPEICRYRVGGTLEKLYWDPSVLEDFRLEKRSVARRDSSVERRMLAPQPYCYEDLVALDGGEEGMDIITHILTLVPRLLNASGSIFLEVDPRHPELVSSWLQSRPDLRLSLVAVRKDFCGRPRFLHVRKSAA